MREAVIQFERAGISLHGFSRHLGALIAVVLLLGLGSLWIQGRKVDVGRQIKAHEQELAELESRITGVQSALARLEAPAVIRGKLLEQQITMVVPFPEDIVRLDGSPSPSGAVSARAGGMSLASAIP
ncbi:MAG TPA: hypothetical protein PK636_00755 [bacterium]|nr:hypothetical protein [bacterium]HPJ71195.1 hypothetical protein [bacterium]HPQ66960.1 hypothetical protein [bacterium]